MPKKRPAMLYQSIRFDLIGDNMGTSKKGLSVGGAMGSLVLVLLVVVVLTYSFNKPAQASNKFFSSALLKIANDKCKFDGDMAKSQGIDFKDADKDGHPDSCDVCINGDKGDNSKDSDLDGMPDACDEDDNNPKKSGCSGSGWLNEAKKQGRCVK